MTILMRAVECVMDSNSKANREAISSFNPLLRFPDLWNATLLALELGSTTGFTKKAIIPQKASHNADAHQGKIFRCVATSSLRDVRFGEGSLLPVRSAGEILPLVAWNAPPDGLARSVRRAPCNEAESAGCFRRGNT